MKGAIASIQKPTQSNYINIRILIIGNAIEDII